MRAALRSPGPNPEALADPGPQAFGCASLAVLVLQQVSDELVALAVHQRELGKAKAISGGDTATETWTIAGPAVFCFANPTETPQPRRLP